MFSLRPRILGRGLLSLEDLSSKVKTKPIKLITQKGYVPPSASSKGHLDCVSIKTCWFLYVFLQNILTARPTFGLGIRFMSVPPVSGLGVKLYPFLFMLMVNSRPQKGIKKPQSSMRLKAKPSFGVFVETDLDIL